MKTIKFSSDILITKKMLNSLHTLFALYEHTVDTDATIALSSGLQGFNYFPISEINNYSP